MFSVSQCSLIPNYIGQLRLYSFVDLILFLVAIGADGQRLAGALVLWIGFLCFLEGKHKHKYRALIPRYLWMPFFFIGTCTFGGWGMVFFFFGVLYSEKKKSLFASIAPLFRGAQVAALAVPIVGLTPFAFLAVALTIIRNFFGDVRDAGKDVKEGTRTLPVLMGLRWNVPYIHLIAMMVTSFIWWSWAGMPVWVLFCTWTLQLSTYHLTPR